MEQIQKQVFTYSYSAVVKCMDERASPEKERWLPRIQSNPTFDQCWSE